MLKIPTLLVSLATLAIGVFWFAVPGSYPYGAADAVTVSVTHLIGRELGAGLMLASGALGLLLSLVDRPAVAGAGAAAQAVLFLLVLSDASLMASIGYALIPVVIGGALVLIAIGVFRKHPAGYAAALVLAALAVAMATGLIDASVIGRYFQNLAKGFGEFGIRIAWSWTMAVIGGVWAWRAYTALVRGRATAGDPRWGRIVTILASLGAVPYALIRLSWLTPWPLGGVDPETGRIELVMRSTAAVDVQATRLQGVLIGLSAVLALILTLGLISRWGERFPRWVPLIGGREVPVKLAVVPGMLGALVLCVAAPGLLVKAVETGYLMDGFLTLLIFPAPLWGPLLAAAVYAYWRRRSPEAAMLSEHGFASVTWRKRFLGTQMIVAAEKPQSRM